MGTLCQRADRRNPRAAGSCVRAHRPGHDGSFRASPPRRPRATSWSDDGGASGPATGRGVPSMRNLPRLGLAEPAVDSLVDTPRRKPPEPEGPEGAKSVVAVSGGGGTRTPKGVSTRRISSAVPYQLGLRLRKFGSSVDTSIPLLPVGFKSGRPDSNRGPLRPERSALPD